jgi:hypothetical protein
MAAIPVQAVNITKSLKTAFIDREVYAKLQAKRKLESHPATFRLQSAIKFADSWKVP